MISLIFHNVFFAINPFCEYNKEKEHIDIPETWTYIILIFQNIYFSLPHFEKNATRPK